MGLSLSDADFETMFKSVGPTELARQLKVSERAVYDRRQRLEQKIGRQITGPEHARRTRSNIAHPHRLEIEISTGIVLVGSDAHYWPETPSPAHRAFVKLAKQLKPAVIVMNGDAFDGASVSRHPPIGWADVPTVQEEIEACQDRLHEIEKAAGRARKIWPLGNHDSRYETRIATVAPEYAKVAGTSLKDHFPAWEPCWSLWINPAQPFGVVIKHRWRGGVHGAHNNTVNSGKTMITGHDHALRVSPFSDYNGTRWGVSTGTLSRPYGPQYVDYTEDNSRNQRAGFVVLTFDNSRLLWPEIVSVIDEDSVEFRGAIIKV